MTYLVNLVAGWREMVIFSGTVRFFPWSKMMENPELADVAACDKRNWTRCFSD